MSFVTMMEGHLAWGDKPLLDNADLTVEAGQRIGLIGRNGTGKSSLLKAIYRESLAMGYSPSIVDSRLFNWFHFTNAVIHYQGSVW